ncbi:hypothetical protein P692DRAFT_20837260 [Suillus brevipes Sb2]|nr:hypothetical protein P692DRAFT_20837260 [Suillus brevipes Sb2]
MAGYHALRDWAEKAKQQMEADYAMKKLMEAENGRLRRQLFGQKQNGPRREGGSGSRHMTCNDMLDALAKADWTANIKVVHTEGRREERDQRAAAKEAAKAVKTAMTLAAKRIADAQKAAKRELVLAHKAEEAAAKKAAVEAKRSAAAAKRADAEEKKRVAHERKMAARVEKERKQLITAQKISTSSMITLSNLFSPQISDLALVLDPSCIE